MLLNTKWRNSIAGDKPRCVMSDYLSLFSMVLVMLYLCRMQHEDYVLPSLPVIAAVFALNLFALPRFSGSAMKPFLPFMLLIPVEMIVQVFFGDVSYSSGSALYGAFFTMLLVVCGALFFSNEKLQEGYWRIISAFSVAASLCVLVEYFAYTFASARLYEVPFVGDFVFNAWEFGGIRFRPCAFYSEASHFAMVALLGAFYQLFIRRNVVWFSVIALACVFSTSSLGIAGVAFMVFAYVFFFSFTKESIRNRGGGRLVLAARMLLIGLVLIAVVLLLAYVQSASIWYIDRFFDGATASTRISRSYELFALLNPLEQLFGIGIQNQEIYLNANAILLPSDGMETAEVNREFAATLGYILCTCGLFGLLSFLRAFFPGIVRGKKEARVLLLLSFGVLFSSCIFSNLFFLVYVYVILCCGSNLKGLLSFEGATEGGVDA